MTNTLKKSLAAVVMLGAIAFIAPTVKADTVSDLMAQLAALQAQIAALTGGSSSSCTTFGLPGVTGVQQAVNQLGYTPMLNADGAMGAKTKAGVMWAQAKLGVTADGAWGAKTNAAYTAWLATCAGGNNNTGGNTGGNSGPLSGGAGSITVDDSSEFNAEEVGEGDEDVAVLEFNVEADDESDVEITSVKVEMVESGSTSSEDLDDYAESVSIWLDGEMVGEADADDFTENSDVWTKSISLDNAIVRAGEDMDFVVAVTALNNLDSGDIDSDAWTADVLNVRFEDADGVVTTEDTDGDTLEKTFDFASFAAATDLDFQVSLNSDEDEINEAHVIDVDTSDDTDDVEILAFTLEAEGDSDVMVSELPITITTTGETDEAVIVIAAHLVDEDGEVLATEDVPTGGAVVFEDLDIEVKADETANFMITVDLQDVDGVLDNGDTVKAEITTGNADAIDAEDETGEELSTSDISGSAVGEAHTTLASGIMVKFVEASTDKDNGEQAVNSDVGTFTIEFDVTAFDTDVFIDKTAPDATGGATESDIDLTGAGTLLCTIDSNADEGTDGFEVIEDDTERFTVTCDVRDGGTDMVDGFFSVALTSILYATTDVDGDTVYNYSMEDFKTGEVFLDDRE